MLDQIGGFMSEVGRIVRSHHERWDGSGFPDGLAGTWSAITTNRAYRGAMTFEAAAEELARSAGTQLDPDVVAAAMTVLSA